MHPWLQFLFKNTKLHAPPGEVWIEEMRNELLGIASNYSRTRAEPFWR